MARPRNLFCTGIFVFSLLPFCLFGQDKAPAIHAAAFASLLNYAEERRIPCRGLHPPSSPRKTQPGDSVTMLLTRHLHNSKPEQWLIYLQAAAARAGEILPAANSPVILYTTFGRKLEFASAPIMASVRTLGPFVEAGGQGRAPTVEDRQMRFVLDEGLLGLGFDRAAAATMRVHQALVGGKTSGIFDIQEKPFTPREVAVGQRVAQEYHITAAEEAAWAGTGPALNCFGDFLHQGPAINAIFFKAVKLPPIWTFLGHGLNDVSLTQWPGLASLAPPKTIPLRISSPLYFDSMGLEINGRPALNFTLLVTDPKPPLRICGGIVGLLALNPNDRENYVTLEVISAGSGLPP